MHTDSIFCLNLHHRDEQKAALRSEPAGSPDKTEDEGEEEKRGNATQQLGAI